MFKRACTYTYICLAVAVAAAALATPVAKAQTATRPATATDYTYAECLGTHMPYAPPADGLAPVPDSLTVIFIDHVGRHGARQPTSAKKAEKLLRFLDAHPLTAAGEQAAAVARQVLAAGNGRWGTLDSLGAEEQHGIARRMVAAYPRLFADGRRVEAQSSYVPRCVMSMYEFLHQVNTLRPAVEVSSAAGPQLNPLLRPFQVDENYVAWKAQGAWRTPYDMMFATSAPSAPARRLTTDALTGEQAQGVTMDLYDVLSGLPAAGLPDRLGEFFTLAEANDTWALSNLSHYLQRCATTLSTLPADIAGQLLAELIETLDNAAIDAPHYAGPGVMLRFGHAETLMPLLSLMRLPGCYYLTNYFDTVALHWRDFAVVPMAANLQMVLLQGPSGMLYLRLTLNERVVVLDGAAEFSPGGFMPWQRARNYLLGCLPL